MVAVADRPLRIVTGTWKWTLDALGNWAGYNSDAGDGSSWDLKRRILRGNALRFAGLSK
ncbi:MAG: hypothetical protein NT049_16840 [Planctomycetota bacterium]|nr:hypothetical protein [Planctomycetota bacterium]